MMIILLNPDIVPVDAMIAPDFWRWRVPATESIAVALVEGARARQRHKSVWNGFGHSKSARRGRSRDGAHQKDKRGRIHWCNIRVH